MTTKNLTLRIATALLLAVPATATITATPAHAFFGGFGRIVYDPQNDAENIVSAARALEQINNQISSLQNEAQMLINQARNLTSLPYSALQDLQQSVQRTQQLLSEAQRIAYDVQAIDQAFQTDYGPASLTATDQALVDGARERWQTTVGGLQDAMRVQAGVVGNAVRLRSARPLTEAKRSSSDRYRSSSGRENHSDDTRFTFVPRDTSTL